jgi:hypothetical protein
MGLVTWCLWAKAFIRSVHDGIFPNRGSEEERLLLTICHFPIQLDESTWDNIDVVVEGEVTINEAREERERERRRRSERREYIFQDDSLNNR